MISIKLNRYIRGYGWEIRVEAETPLEALELVQHLENQMDDLYGQGTPEEIHITRRRGELPRVDLPPME